MAEMDITKTYAQAVLRHSVKTNADRIRAMSDEELVELLACGCCRSPDTGCPKAFQTGSAWRNCSGCWLDWLKQEVDSDPT